jgi:hypothetical protein
MDGSIPITTRTGIGLPGLATIAAVLTRAMEVAVIGAGPAAVDPAAMVDPAAVVVAMQVVVTIIMTHRPLRLPPYLAIQVGVRLLERAAVIVRHPRQSIAVRSKSTSEGSQARRQAARTRVRHCLAFFRIDYPWKFNGSFNQVAIGLELPSHR